VKKERLHPHRVKADKDEELYRTIPPSLRATSLYTREAKKVARVHLWEG